MGHNATAAINSVSALSGPKVRAGGELSEINNKGMSTSRRVDGRSPNKAAHSLPAKDKACEWAEANAIVVVFGGKLLGKQISSTYETRWKARRHEEGGY